MFFYRVVTGEGELDRVEENTKSFEKKVLDGCPYLLLDVRDKDCFDQCRLITGWSIHLIKVVFYAPTILE